MTGLILISHGPLAQAALETVKMLQGETKKARAITFKIGESAEQLKTDIKAEIESLNADSILIIVDILGGTPFNVSSFLMKDHNINVITGMNIPALVEVLPLIDESDLDELSEIAVTAGKNGIIDVKQRLNSKGKR